MPNKFKKGRQITFARDAVDAILLGRWLYLGNKPIHCSFMISQTLWTIKQEATGGRIFEALNNEEGK